jgi:hypothetical protein
MTNIIENRKLIEIKKKGGPSTPEGKATCSKNAMTHGLTGALRMLKDEKEEDFDELICDLILDWKPRTCIEQLQIENIGKNQWLYSRALRLQADCFLDDGTIDEKRMALLMRYQTTHFREMQAAIKTLENLQKNRLTRASWSVSQAKEYYLAGHKHPFNISPSTDDPKPGHVYLNMDTGEFEEKVPLK